MKQLCIGYLDLSGKFGVDTKWQLIQKVKWKLTKLNTNFDVHTDNSSVRIGLVTGHLVYPIRSPLSCLNFSHEICLIFDVMSFLPLRTLLVQPQSLFSDSNPKGLANHKYSRWTFFGEDAMLYKSTQHQPYPVATKLLDQHSANTRRW